MNKKLFSHRSAGMTIVELLAVLVLIFLWGLLLVPILGHSSDQAFAIYCLNNQSAIARGLIQYSAEWSVYLPSMISNMRWPVGLVLSSIGWGFFGGVFVAMCSATAFVNRARLYLEGGALTQVSVPPIVANTVLEAPAYGKAIDATDKPA